MSHLMKIFSAPETKIIELRTILFRQGISTITKTEYQPHSTSTTEDKTLELYIDSDQEDKANAILDSFNKQSA